MMIKTKKKDNTSTIPWRATEHAACFDVYAHSITVINEYKMEIGLGFMTEIPNGWKGIIVPRSSLSKTDWMFSNSLGVVDSDYRGEWRIILSHVRNDGRMALFPYKVGDRVGQIYFAPVHEVNFNIVDELSDTLRGNGSFGSTGI